MASYPLYRRPTASISLAANLDTKHFYDETIAGESSDRRVNMVTLGLGGNRQDNLGLGGLTDFSISWVHGNTNEDNDAARAADDASRKALGSYNKLMYNLGRQQKLGEGWALVGKLRGQIAFDNIESSGRFSLGGADGLRAYPTGEAIADEGWLLSLNLVHAFNQKLQGTVFVDTGRVRVNHNSRSGINPTNARDNNRYSLSGLGVALDWNITDHLALTTILAAPIGSNPGRDASGNDTDARDQNLRGWINLVGQF
jgi:hemolysin activation/secretion protein